MRLRRFLVHGALAAFMAAHAAAEEPSRRIIAIGDVHGSLKGLTTILRETELIDDDGAWSGGSATLVQVGDLLDRGRDVRAVMDLMMRLQVEAPKVGGEVVCLLGNHEAMNILGIARDVHYEAYMAFVDDESERKREATFKATKSTWKKWARVLGLQLLDSANDAREQWFDSHPPGKIEYLEALGPGAVYGSWLRSRPAVVVRDEILFVHGGLGPELRGLGPDEVNQKVAEEIRRFDTYRHLLAENGLAPATASISEVVMVGNAVIRAAERGQGSRAKLVKRLAAELEGVSEVENWNLVSPGGPLWFRGGAMWDEGEKAQEMADLIDSAGAARMVIGHTVQRSGQINSRFSDRVIAIDTGMLSNVYRGGRASALRIDGDQIFAVYPGEEYLLEAGSWVRQ